MNTTEHGITCHCRKCDDYWDQDHMKMTTNTEGRSPPFGHVRLPDGRDVKISDAGMTVLYAIADGNPLGVYVTAGILDWPRDYQTQHPTTKGSQ